MVQTKQKRGIEVENPSSRSVSGGWRTSLILRHRLCWATFRATSQMRRCSFWVSSLILRRRSFRATLLILSDIAHFETSLISSDVAHFEWHRSFWDVAHFERHFEQRRSFCDVVHFERCHEWMGHVTYVLSHVMHEWVMSRVKES